ncbi:MAG: hypothetical protein ABL966_08175 [Acidimicrobiales bacterium]
MEDEAPGEPEDGPGLTNPWPTLPEEVTSGDDELRQLVDAGASTPEELRARAARIREHREHEDAVWRAEVRPAILKAKKGRGKAAAAPVSVAPSVTDSLPHGVIVALAVAGVMIGILLAATQATVLVLLVPVTGVLLYAYVEGRRETTTPDPTTPVDGDAPD